MRRSGALYQVINRKERRRAEARLGNQGRSQAAQQRQLCSGSARDNVGAREQGSDRGSHEILLVLGRQTTWPVDHILSTPGLSDNDRIAILGGTAVGLLGIKSSKGRDPQPARQNFRHPDRGSQVRSRPDGGGSRALRIAFRSPWTTRAKIQLPVGVDLRAANIPSSIYVVSGTMKARPVGVGQSKWIIHDTARAMSCRSLPFGTSPSAPPFSGEHAGPIQKSTWRPSRAARIIAETNNSGSRQRATSLART